MFIKTKRFLYDIIIEKIAKAESNRFGFTKSFIAVLGARKVGKTILFQQLAEYYGNKALYFDCSNISILSDFTFKNFYEDAYNKGIRYVFLDETCKIGAEHYIDFIQNTKLYYAGMNICITGSVYFIVEHQSEQIGRGIDIDLPQITYIERLCWDNNLEKIDIDFIKNTSDSNLKEYLKNQMLSDEALVDYMKRVIIDTIDSYRERTSLEGLDKQISDKVLINALKYISLCQLVYKKDNGKYVDLPLIENDLEEKIFDNYELAKNKYNLKNKEIKTVLDILLGCGLAKRTRFITSKNFRTLDIEDIEIPAILFEYPWFSNVCLSTEIQKSEAIVDQLIEYIILLRASYIYEEVDKLRVDNTNEIDIIYLTKFKYSGLEVKNKPYENNKIKYINRMNTFAKEVNLQEFLLSSNDSINRNDKIVACLELEYINVVREGTIWSEKSIGTLLNKFE